MENYTYEGTNQKIIEQFQLIIYTIYSISIVSLLSGRGVVNWILFLLLSGLALSWIVYVGKFKTYAFRARFTSIMMQGSMVLYATQVEDLFRALPVFMLFVVLLGMYGVTDVIYISMFSIIIIFGYHGIVLRSIPLSSANEMVTTMLQLGNVLLLEYVVYVWTRKNRDGSRSLLRVVDELEEVEHSKDDFMANVSHEIRTPLNTICGMSEIVLREELPYKTREHVLNIQLAGRNLMAVVSDILDYSELQSGKIELEEEAYNLSSTINDVINMTMARKNEKNIELVVDCDANIPSVLWGDEKKLRRIILKLVDNAIKFTEEGCVCISIGCRRETYGINLLVSVKDTGIGMDEQSLENLFAKFNQADTSTIRQEGGIGLGLAISNALVNKMGGAITVRSKPDKGTVVQIAIPQKVLDETPMAALSNREQLNVATYIDMEQFDMVEIRDEYSKTIVHMVEQLKVKCHICQHFVDLQRCVNREKLTHVFISTMEYRRNASYFNELAMKTKVIVVLDHFDDEEVTNSRIYKIYKPFHVLTIVSAVNASGENENSWNASQKLETRDTRVLVVDDNRMNLRVIEGLLANYKIRVTTATSGQETLQKISTAEYDLVFMDHMMPEMDGVETLHRIRHKVGTYFQKVPVIAVTANAVAGTREMFIAEGFSDFIEKPVERSVLERVLRRHLPSEKIVSREERKVSEGEAVAEHSKQAEMMEEQGQMLALPTMDQLEAAFGPKGLDVHKGVLYCNGIEGYISVLQGYCDESDALDVMAEQLFEKEDWKNYVIAIHGIKGAMRSIGATALSELARKLEFAGKEGRLDYIAVHHKDLMEEYRTLFAGLMESEWITASESGDSDAEQYISLSVLEKEVFDRIIMDMETAMYAWDGERLLEIVTELQSHQYKGASLKELLAPVKKKVEMSDYVSAVELTVRLKNQLESKGR